MINSYQNSIIAQLLEAITGQINFSGTPTSNIGDILLSILEQTPYDKEPKSVLAELFLKLKDKLEGRAFTPYDKEPRSAIAEILLSILNETEYDKEPNSHIAELLLELKAELESYAELTASGAIANFTTSVVKPLVNLTAYFNATQEAGTPTPQSPKAITGVSAVSVIHLGKNLFDKTNSSAILEAYLNAGVVFYNPTCRVVFVECKPNTTYTVSKIAGKRFSVAYTTETPAIGVSYYGNIGNNTGSEITITTGANAKYLISFVFNGTYDTITAEEILASVQIEVGSSATPFEAYKTPITTLINLGGTYYGGYVTQDKDGKRELVVTHKLYDLSLLSWQVHQQGFYNATKPDDMFKYLSTETPDWIAEKYQKATGQWIYGHGSTIGYIGANGGLIYCTDSTTPSGYMVAPLTEPFTVALPDGEPITAFNGVNNIYNDSGDTSVTYLAKIEDNLNATAKFRAEEKAQKEKAKEEEKEIIKEDPKEEIKEPIKDSGETKKGANKA